MGEMTAFGKFRIVGKLAQRGAWAVFDAVEVALERPVELRVFGEPLTQGSPRQQAFLQRLMRIAAVDHPNVLGILDFNMVMDKGYYTTSPREAVPVSAAFASHEFDLQAEEKKLSVCIELCRGLQAVHDAGLVHGAVGPETVYWDQKRQFAYLAWLPIADVDGREIGHEGAPIPAGRREGEAPGRGEDLYRLSALLHQILTGSAPLGDAPPGSTSTAVAAGGAVEGSHDVMVRALEVDRERATRSASEVAAALEKVLAKQKVRSELEKSVSSIVIPQEMLEAALARKKEQRKRRSSGEGPEAPAAGPAEILSSIPLSPKALGMIVGMIALLVLSPLFGPSGDPGPTPVRPPATDRPPPSRPPPTGSPSPGTPTATPAGSPAASSAPIAPGDISGLKGAGPTDAQSFGPRWDTLKTWILSLPPARRRNLFTYGKLLQVKSGLKQDEAAACRELDQLIQQAVSEGN